MKQGLHMVWYQEIPWYLQKQYCSIQTLTLLHNITHGIPGDLIIYMYVYELAREEYMFVAMVAHEGNI